MDAWTQVYNPVAGSVGWSALIAGIPIYALFYLLAVKRMAGHLAGIVASILTLILGIAAWGIPAVTGINSYVYGFLTGLFPIAWVVLMGVWLYNMTVESGEFEIIKTSLISITDDRRLQAVLIAFAFGAFIEGTAGFGTPVAITAAMLMGLGFNPLYAAGICLLANTAPVAFGSVGIPILALCSTHGFDPLTISKIVGRILPTLSFIVPIWLSVTMCGFKRTKEVLPALLVAGLAFAITQFLVSNFHGPTLPDIASAVVTIIVLLGFLRVWKPKHVFHFPDEPPSTGVVKCTYSGGQVLRAWLPYLFMAILVFLQGWPSIKAHLVVPGVTWAFHWPSLDNLIISHGKPLPYVYAFQPLAASGTVILVAGLLAVPFMPKYGYGKAIACLGRTFIQLRWPIFTIGNILALAFVMNAAGMTTTIGLALAATGAIFPFFAPILGWLGVFLSGSDTSSNVLFGGLQKTTAQAIGLNPNLMAAANSAGGVVGKMISPQSIAVGVAATNQQGQDGNLFRFTVLHSLGMLLIICVIVLLFAYPLSGLLPVLAQ